MRVVLMPSDTFGGHTQAEFHYRLAESQFLRMAGSIGSYHVTKIEVRCENNTSRTQAAAPLPSFFVCKSLTLFLLCVFVSIS